jgi:hypothetical protein
MAVLNAWQRIDRVLPGMPFGNGSAGNATISSSPNSYATASGSASSTSLTIGSTILSNGDVFVVHQTYGTGAGQWEINRVASGGGTTSITCLKPLQYTYGTGAQVIKFNMNNVVTVNNHSVTAWNGSIGGIEVICGKTSVTVSGTLSVRGTDVDSGGAGAGRSGGGFRGGTAVSDKPGTSWSGDGTNGLSARQYTPRGNGGGGGCLTSGSNQAGGGGGGHANKGGDGKAESGCIAGQGGNAVGIADLTNINMGGGGGGKSTYGSFGGASGGGIVIILAKTIGITGSIIADGGASVDGGGAGAGGSVLVVAKDVTLGTNTVTSLGKPGGSGGHDGGGSSAGRIAVHHSGTVTGTTNPAFYDQSDPTLVELSAGGAFLFNMI